MWKLHPAWNLATTVSSRPFAHTTTLWRHTASMNRINGMTEMNFSCDSTRQLDRRMLFDKLATFSTVALEQAGDTAAA
jgi:hypothetical protein